MHDKLLSAIETIYDCVGDDYDRARALQTYSRTVDDSAVILADLNMHQGRATRLDWHNVAEGVTEAYAHRIDCPVREKLMEALKDHPPCVPMLRQSVVSGDEWYNSLVYEIGSKPWDMHGEGTSYISGDILTRTFCFFLRHTSQKPLNAEMFSIMAILNKHFHRAMTVQQRINRLEEALIKSCNVLDLIEFGLVLYGTDQTPIFVNAAAQRILDADDGMRLLKNELVIGDRSGNEQFAALIEAIHKPNFLVNHRAGGIITIPRLSRLRPYSLMVVPMECEKISMEGVTAAVFLFDPETRKTTAIDMFVSSYELTRSEAELAHCLALGDSLEEAAEKRGVSRNTAKSQLHSIFTKTDTNRQSELISLLLRSVAGISLKKN